MQEWLHIRHSGYMIGPAIIFESWGAQYFLWGVIGWTLWRLFRHFISKHASILRMAAVSWSRSASQLCFIEEMIWVIPFPNIPLDRPPRCPYMDRVSIPISKRDLG